MNGMSAEVSRENGLDSTPDTDDNQIKLVDSTIIDSEEAPPSHSDGSWRKLARDATHTSVREQLTRRKYASWRKDKFDTDENAHVDEEEGGESVPKPINAKVAVHPDNDESQTVDFGRRPGTSDESTKPDVVQPRNVKTKPKKKSNKPDFEIEILYENQRGSFFCGIPLYSHSSLLNFDPAAWVTRDFKNSSVNITNAQVPDPSWMWAWKSWYVDMSYDVDEEGWQYSFSFGKNFAWHGTHPWFHSFVRRRRWLRKRVKRTDERYRNQTEGSMEAAHHLNTDYFTIHSKPRDRSPGSELNPEAQLARPASYTSIASIEQEITQPEEIRDIPSLMKAIRVATIDREKIDAIKHFITNGGDELFYLSDNMSEIMSQLVFQNSKRQILEYLTSQARIAQEHRDEHDAEDKPEGPNEKRRIDNLLKAAEAANEEIHGLEYWSDRKHVLPTEDEGDMNNDEHQLQSFEADVVGEIRGISDKSQTSREIRIDRRLTDKGKQPERQPVDDRKDKGEQKSSESHIGKDDLLMQDDDPLAGGGNA